MLLSRISAGGPKRPALEDKPAGARWGLVVTYLDSSGLPDETHWFDDMDGASAWLKSCPNRSDIARSDITRV